MSKQILDKFFDVTLTSDGNFDLYGNNNTPSFFKSKLPEKFNLPLNTPFKVALHKLIFTNTFSNIGSDLNKRLWVTVKKFAEGPREIFFPESCVDNIDDFLHFVEHQMRIDAPELFHHQDSGGGGKRQKRSLPSPAEEEEKCRSDLTEKNHREMTHFKNILLRSILNEKNSALKIGISLAGHFIDSFKKIESFLENEQTTRDWWRNCIESTEGAPFGWDVLYREMHWLNSIFSEFVAPAVDLDIFSPDGLAKLEEMKTAIVERKPKLFEFSEDAMKQERKKKSGGTDEDQALDSIQLEPIFAKLKELFESICSEDATSESMLPAALGFLGETFEETEECLLKIENLYEKSRIYLKSVPYRAENQEWNFTDIAETTLQISIFLKHIKAKYGQLMQSVGELLTPEETRKRPELIVKNPETGVTFKDINEFDQFIKSLYDSETQRVNGLVSKMQKFYSDAYVKYEMKKASGDITDETPTEDLTPDEQQFRYYENRNRPSGKSETNHLEVMKEFVRKYRKNIPRTELKRKNNEEAEEQQPAKRKQSPPPPQNLPRTDLKRKINEEEQQSAKRKQPSPPPSPQQPIALALKLTRSVDKKTTPHVTSPFHRVKILEDDSVTNHGNIRVVSNAIFNPKGKKIPPPTEKMINDYLKKKATDEEIQRQFTVFLAKNRKEIALKEEKEKMEKEWLKDQSTDDWYLLEKNITPDELAKQHEKIQAVYDIEPASSSAYEPQELISDDDALKFNVIPVKKIQTMEEEREEEKEIPVTEPPETVKEAEKKLRKTYFGERRENWDDVDKLKASFKRLTGGNYLVAISAFIPGALASDTILRLETNTFVTDVTNVNARPKLDRWFDKYNLKMPDILKDYHYYLFGQSGSSWFEKQLGLTVNLTFGRLHYLENLMKKISEDELKSFRENISKAKPLTSDETETSFSKLANTIVIRSNSAEFDLGASEEMLNMLGLEKTFSVDAMKERCTARRYLNMIVRDNKQLELDPYSLMNFYLTFKNARETTGENWDQTINKETKSRPYSMIPAESILHFKNLFMSPKNKAKLSLHDERSDLFRTYLVFLKETLKIDHLSLATSTLMRLMPDEISRTRIFNFFVTDFREYLKIFYGRDPIFSKFLENSKRTFRQMPLLDIDLITFCLWKCSLQMPLGTGIRANFPPQLNPMAQIWIYSNIVRETAVNNSYQKLLAVGTVKEKPKGSQQELTFNEPMFKHLNASSLDEIEILITDKFGNPIPFRGGPSTVVLQFESV